MAPEEHMSDIMLVKPEAGVTAIIAMRGGAHYILPFPPDTVTFDCCGDDVRIRFDDGAEFILQSFYSTAQVHDFSFEFPEGIMVSGKDMGETFLPIDPDFTTGSGFAEVGIPAGDAVHIASIADAQDTPTAFPVQDDSSILLTQADTGNTAGSPTPSDWGPATRLPADVFFPEEDDSLDAVLTPSYRAPVCSSFCDLSHDPGNSAQASHESIPGNAAPTPVPEVELPASLRPTDIVHAPEPRSSLIMPQEETEILLLEDLLDVTTFSYASGIETEPFFQSLFLSSEEAAPLPDTLTTNVEFHYSASHSGEGLDEGADGLLLSFLRLGTL